MSNAIMHAIPAAPTMKDVIQSFHLTSGELAEVDDYKSGKFDTLQGEELKELAKTTTNAGLQYLLLDNTKVMTYVAGSNFLDARVVSPFLKAITDAKMQALQWQPAAAIFALLSHKIVVSDVKLFKRTWRKTEVAVPTAFDPSLVGASDFANLFYPLHTHSIAEGKESNAMSIDTLMLILAHLHRNEKYETDPSLATVRDKALKSRETEIKEWISERMPDLVGLPLSWILEVSDLYIDL